LPKPNVYAFGVEVVQPLLHLFRYLGVHFTVSMHVSNSLLEGLQNSSKRDTYSLTTFKKLLRMLCQTMMHLSHLRRNDSVLSFQVW
jgi:hypothetical protein